LRFHREHNACIPRRFDAIQHQVHKHLLQLPSIRRYVTPSQDRWRH
jgi:hypothetical protein